MALPRITSPKCIFITIVLSLTSVFASAGLVQRTNKLSVKVGRTIFLNTDDIVIKQLRREEACRIQVVDNDPITQRVGKIEPKVSNLREEHSLYFI